MEIGIIGAGEIGGTLARQYRSAGHNVKIANAIRVDHLNTIAKETGALPVTVRDAVEDVDVIVISIPFFAVRNLTTGLFENVSDETAIIDTCNYYPIVSGVIQEVLDGMPESVWVSNQIGKPVIKAYNTILYRSLIHSGVSAYNGSRIVLPISGDNKKSKEVVASLINDSGFDPYDLGMLKDSWRQEPGSPVYCTDLNLDQLKRSITNARRELLPARRELGLKKILEIGPERWTDLVQINRTIYESADV